MGLGHDGGPAPYSPAKNIVTIIDQYRDRGLGQTPFTPDTFARIGIGGALAQRAVQSLKLLDLLDDEGNPTETMQGLRLATSEEFHARVADAVRAAYAPIFQFADPSQDGSERIRDAFRVYAPHAQQDKMVRLFIGLCEYAGIREVQEKRPSTSTSSAPRPRQAAPRKPKLSNPAEVLQRKSAAGGGSGIGMIQGVPLPIAALMQKLPPEGGSWTEDDKERFMTAFEALLGFSYRIVDPVEIDEAEAEMGGDDEQS